MHVYGDLLDSAFLFDKNYNIKRYVVVYNNTTVID